MKIEVDEKYLREVIGNLSRSLAWISVGLHSGEATRRSDGEINAKGAANIAMKEVAHLNLVLLDKTEKGPVQGIPEPRAEFSLPSPEGGGDLFKERQDEVQVSVDPPGAPAASEPAPLDTSKLPSVDDTPEPEPEPAPAGGVDAGDLLDGLL